MNKKEYQEYEEAVAHTFKEDGIVNLSHGHLTCPDCNFDFFQDSVDTETVKCGCGNTKEVLDAPSFSWRPCECCGSRLGGDRYHTTGFNPEMKEVYEYEICEDCLYYAEYRRLDDMTMMDMED